MKLEEKIDIFAKTIVLPDPDSFLKSPSFEKDIIDEYRENIEYLKGTGWELTLTPKQGWHKRYCINMFLLVRYFCETDCNDFAKLQQTYLQAKQMWKIKRKLEVHKNIQKLKDKGYDKIVESNHLWRPLPREIIIWESQLGENEWRRINGLRNDMIYNVSSKYTGIKQLIPIKHFSHDFKKYIYEKSIPLWSINIENDGHVC